MDDVYSNYSKQLYRINDPRNGMQGGTVLNSSEYSNNAGGGGTVDAGDIQDGILPGGIVVRDGNLESYNFKSGTQGWQISANGSVEFNDGVFRGTVTVDEIHIGGNDATSAHIDTDGNFWSGAGNGSYSTAPTRISASGAAHFENVEIGGSTIQYVITNSGIFSFGDGSDGDATISSNTTLTADKYYDNLTVNSGVTLNPGGYRIFVKNTLTVNGSIARNGGNGSNGFGSMWPNNGGGNGASLADGYLKGAPASGAGGAGGRNGGGQNPGGAGTSVTNAIGSAAGVAGQQGGASTNGSNGAGGAGGAGGTTTAANCKLIANWHLATLLDISSSGSSVKYTGGGTAGGGGGGGPPGGGVSADGGGGGGGGGNGGIIAIYARKLIIGSSGSIAANGGNGGDGGNGASSGYPVGPGPFWVGNGGGGAGGNGGVIILVYNQLTNGGSITASAGTGGMGGGQQQIRGSDPTPSVPNTQANNGSSGTIYQFQLSL